MDKWTGRLAQRPSKGAETETRLDSKAGRRPERQAWRHEMIQCLSAHSINDERTEGIEDELRTAFVGKGGPA